MVSLENPIPALIYCAGLGTRMRHLTADRPKPLIEVGGKALVDHAIDQLRSDQVSNFVVNLHHKSEQIRSHFRDRDILFSDETDEPLETGGGLKNALPLLNSDLVLTMNSDAVWDGGSPLETLLKAWRPEFEGLLLLVPNQRAIGHPGNGDFTLNQNKQLSRSGPYIYTGLQLIRTNRFLAVPQHKFSTNLVWDEMIQSGGLHGVIYPGRWCDVGTPESIPLAEEMLNPDA